MAPMLQLDLFGPPMPVVSVAAPVEPPALADAESPSTELPAAPVDPRQINIFDGHLSAQRSLERACEKLDIATARALWERYRERFTSRLERWPAWIDDLAWFVDDDTPADERLARVCTLVTAVTPESARGHFVGMADWLRSRVVCELLGRAALTRIATHGPAATLPDGRPAAFLLLAAGRHAEAAQALAAAAEALPDDGRVRGYLGEALWRAGRKHEALVAYRDAFLVAPRSVDEVMMSCAPLHELLDRAADLQLEGAASAWIPVLADLTGILPLPSTAVAVPPAASEEPAARTVARELLAYRRLQHGRALSDADKLERKRSILRAAPELRELVRRL